MKPVSLMIFAVLIGAASAGQAAERGNCPERGRCLVAPVPPVPPIPPVAPAPPPELPAMPTPPAPPAPPPLPLIPAAAHDACAGKAEGTKMTYRPRRGETMRGTCQIDSQGMYFELHEWRNAK